MRPLSLIVAIVVLIALSVSRIDDRSFAAQPQDSSHGKIDSLSNMSCEAELKLRQDMRKLWTDHVVWTRDYIIAAVNDGPDQDAASKRLLKNQEDIGKAIVPFYGKEAGDKLTSLLKDHITISAALIKAAKAHDKTQVKQIDVTWQKNGIDIADFLSSANPNWPQKTLADMMKMHLSTTTDELNARLDQKWDADVKAFDEVYEHILKMADALSAGIIKQFPDRFS